MKKTFRILGKIFGLIVILLFTILIGEWIYSEIRFQTWLAQDERRMDFSGYDTIDELKETLLTTKLPIGSSEEEVQAFRMANGYSYQKPGRGTKGRVGVVMQEAKHSNRDFFGLKVLLPGVWIIFFELDSTDYSLVDISIELHPGP